MTKKNKPVIFRRPEPYVMKVGEYSNAIPKKPFKPIEYKEVTYGFLKVLLK